MLISIKDIESSAILCHSAKEAYLNLLYESRLCHGKVNISVAHSSTADNEWFTWGLMESKGTAGAVKIVYSAEKKDELIYFIQRGLEWAIAYTEPYSPYTERILIAAILNNVEKYFLINYDDRYAMMQDYDWFEKAKQHLLKENSGINYIRQNLKD